jgi:hypothetical protein
VPLVNFDAIAKLPEDYYKGAEMARARANAFSDGKLGLAALPYLSQR